jgi:hypothetical protein
MSSAGFCVPVAFEATAAEDTMRRTASGVMGEVAEGASILLGLGSSARLAEDFIIFAACILYLNFSAFYL